MQRCKRRRRYMQQSPRTRKGKKVVGRESWLVEKGSVVVLVVVLASIRPQHSWHSIRAAECQKVSLRKPGENSAHYAFFSSISHLGDSRTRVAVYVCVSVCKERDRESCHSQGPFRGGRVDAGRIGWMDSW